MNFLGPSFPELQGTHGPTDRRSTMRNATSYMEGRIKQPINYIAK